MVAGHNKRLGLRKVDCELNKEIGEIINFEEEKAEGLYNSCWFSCVYVLYMSNKGEIWMV